MTSLHPALEPLAAFVGTWSGTGSGEYPTIDPFEYEETVELAHSGLPFLTYVQRTRRPGGGGPMHTETGYLRVPRPGLVEAVIVQPTGIVEVHEGGFEGPTLRLRATTVARTGTAKEVTEVERDLTVDGDVLRYELRMAAVGQPLTHHLAAELRRQ